MKYRFPYYPPTDGQRINHWSNGLWDRAKDLYEREQYKDAFLATLDYLTTGEGARYTNSERTHFLLPHRSFRFDIKLEQDEVHISVPFVRLPQGSTRIAVMRKAAEFNGVLSLARLIKRGDELHSVYSCPLKLASPWKIFGTMRDICGLTNWWAEELCLTFGAERLEQSPYIKPYAPEISSAIYADIQSIGRKALETAKELAQEARYALGAYIIDVAFTQIDFVASPKEHLAREISIILDDLREDLPPEERYRRGVSHMEAFVEKPLEKILPYLYSSPVLFAGKSTVTVPELQRSTSELYDKMREAILKEDYEFVYARLTGEAYDTLRDYYIQPEVETLLIQSLKDAAATKTLKEAAECMFSYLYKLHQGELPTTVRSFNRGQGSSENGRGSLGKIKQWLLGLFSS